MRDPQLPGDVTWPDAIVGQLDNSLTHHVRQGTPVYKDAAQLVHTAVA